MIADRLAEPPPAEIEPDGRVLLTGCGSSYWTGEIGAAVLRGVGVDATAVRASEFLSGLWPTAGATVVGYSQSGETTETVAALRRAAEGGARTVAVTNDPDSTLATESDATAAIGAGREEAILATKSVDGALAVTYAMAAGIGAESPDPEAVADACRGALDVDPGPAVDALADAESAYVLGQGSGYGVAGEAATKVVEGGLVHASALPSLEITHGPLANVADLPVVTFVRAEEDHEGYRALLEQLVAADARPFVVTDGETSFPAAEAVVRLPRAPTVLPLVKAAQRLAVAVGLAKELDPDSPPALSKHVEWTHL